MLDDDEMDEDGHEIDPGPGGLLEAIAKNIAGVCYGLDDLADSVRGLSCRTTERLLLTPKPLVVTGPASSGNAFLKIMAACKS
jgi:hypothetical protein